MTRWLDTHEGPVWRYASPLRPITQLPLARLDQVLDPANLGPDVRDLITARQLTPAEVAAFELRPVPTPEEVAAREYETARPPYFTGLARSDYEEEERFYWRMECRRDDLDDRDEE